MVVSCHFHQKAAMRQTGPKKPTIFRRDSPDSNNSSSHHEQHEDNEGNLAGQSGRVSELNFAQGAP